MTQVARNLTDADDGFLRGMEYLVLDRDPLYTAAFQDLLRDSGVKTLLLPARSPNVNAFAERFVVRQVRVLRPNRATRGATPPSRRPRVHGSLSRGTTAPGFEQRAHRAQDCMARTRPPTMP